MDVDVAPGVSVEFCVLLPTIAYLPCPAPSDEKKKEKKNKLNTSLDHVLLQLMLLLVPQMEVLL